MYLLFNKNIYYNILLCFLVVLMQAYAPKVFVTSNVKVGLDFLLVLITFFVLLKKTYYVIFLGFIFGLLQDFMINVEAIGLCSFIKSLSVYYLSKIKLNNNLWTRSFKFFYIFLVYFLHFFIYYSIINTEISFLFIYLSILHAFFAIVIFYVFEKTLFNSCLL